MKFEIIRDVIVETLNCELAEVTPEARLREDLGADSLAAVELCMALEERFGITIADEKLPSFCFVGDIMEYLREQGV